LRNNKKKTTGSSEDPSLVNNVDELGLVNYGLNAELNPICHLLALLGAHHILHVSRIRVKNQKYKGSTENRTNTHRFTSPQ